MASVRISVETGDGLTVEFERDDRIVDEYGARTLALFDVGVAEVRRVLDATRVPAPPNAGPPDFDG